MGDGGEALAKAISHQSAARTSPLDLLSPFSLSNILPRNNFSVVSRVSKVELIQTVQTPVPRAASKPGSEKEIIQVLHSQVPTAITTSVFNSMPYVVDNRGDKFKLPPLPGGASLADHNLAAIKRSRDWSSAEPMAEELCGSRLPTPGEIGNTRELTIGVSSKEDWKEAMDFLHANLNKEGIDDLPLLAADIESIPIKVNGSLDSGKTKPWEALLFSINMSVLSGAKDVTFTMAKDGSAAPFPTRFFFGNRKWQIHIRLPLTHKRFGGDTQVILDLSTVLPEEAKQLLLSLPPMIGSGITDDYLAWGEILDTIWLTSFFKDMQQPIELEHLARLARVNTVNSGIFFLNWWCLGTIIPKHLASRGDKKWGLPLRDIPPDLRPYLAIDIVQILKVATVLIMTWALQTVPDMTVVREAARFSALQFLQWLAEKAIPVLLTGIQGVIRDTKGVPFKLVSCVTWEEQPTVSAMVARLNPPSLKEFPAIWSIPEWPSVTCGGPRSIHQIRDTFITLLPELQKLDPDRWQIQHPDKLLFWRFGATAVESTPAEGPVRGSDFLRSPALPSRLASNPLLWTSSQFEQSRARSGRSDRMLIAEFVRCHPDRALAVLDYMENHRGKFKQLVGEARTRKIVIDTRTTLEGLGMTIIRPEGWEDPYHVDDLRSIKNTRQLKQMSMRMEELLAQKEVLDRKLTAQKRRIAECSSGDAPAQSAKRAKSIHHESAAAEECIRTVKYRRKPDYAAGHPTRTVKYRGELDENADEIVCVMVANDEEDTPVIPVAIPKPFVKPAPAVQKLTYSQAVIGQQKSKFSSSEIQQIPVITPQMQEVITNTLAADPKSFINDSGKFRITAKDIQATQGDRWLNGDVITAYFQLISDRGGKNGLPSVLGLSTLFYPLLKYSYDRAKQYTQHVDIFSLDMVLIPIHHGVHWGLVVVDMRKRTTTYYDSMLVNGDDDTCVGKILSYLAEEHQHRKGRRLDFQFRSVWNRNVPQQDNGFDCGMFVCRFAEQLSRRALPDATQEHMPLYRQLMVWEIATNQIYSSPSAELDDELIIGIDGIEMKDFEPAV